MPHQSLEVMTNQMRDDDPSDISRRRILFRCWHRGTQESDLVLGSFAESCLAGFDRTQLGRFEALLDCSDPDLFEWILEGATPPAEHDHDVLRMLRAFSNRHDVGQRQIGQCQTSTTP